MLEQALAITSDNVSQNSNSINKRASADTLPRESTRNISRSSKLANTLHEASRQRSDSCPEENSSSTDSSSADDNSKKSTSSSRQRSSSCSILLSSHLTCGGCDTIAEEEDNESSASSLQEAVR
mmetsp:Transcript_21221/g.60897  ORF Transcript_21221/g.60897 Transcript_21221/m.60897 type:complete len:124 (-) Transcript_21221:116-487(-)